MKIIKVVSNVLDKALDKGNYSLNGRYYEPWYGYGELQEKYGATVDKSNILHFRHWGTETIKIDLRNKTVLDFYGEGVSDRDNLNSVLDYFGIGGASFHYYPSKERFILE